MCTISYYNFHFDIFTLISTDEYSWKPLISRQENLESHAKNTLILRGSYQRIILEDSKSLVNTYIGSQSIVYGIVRRYLKLTDFITLPS